MSYFRRALVLVCSISLISSPGFTRQTSSPPISAPALLQHSLAAQLGNTQISDVTLTGSARRIAGSDDETGTITLQAVSSGASRVDLSFSSGPRSEIRSITSSGPSSAWSGPDGVTHSIPYHNAVADRGLLPVFTLASVLSNTNSVITLVGTETHNSQSFLHLTAVQQFPALTGDSAAFAQHLSQLDIFLDATTYLPSSITYNIHPDNNALLDIPVELQFSDYRKVNGSQVPFHIQKFINNSLCLDFQFESAALNKGLSAAQVGAQ